MRSTSWRRTGSGFGDGWLPSSSAICAGDDDRLAVALEALLRDGPLRGEALGLARLLQQRAPLGEDVLGGGAPLAGADEGVAVALELGQLGLALGQDRPRTRATASSATRSRPGLRSPRAWRSRSARSRRRFAALVPAVGAADRGLQPVAQGALVAGEVEDLVVAHRGGRAEELLARGSR